VQGCSLADEVGFGEMVAAAFLARAVVVGSLACVFVAPAWAARFVVLGAAAMSAPVKIRRVVRPAAKLGKGILVCFVEWVVARKVGLHFVGDVPASSVRTFAQYPAQDYTAAAPFGLAAQFAGCTPDPAFVGEHRWIASYAQAVARGAVIARAVVAAAWYA
jgi:hypothetical protein